MTIQIKHIDPTTVEIIQGYDIVKKILSYKAEYYKPAQYGKRKVEYEKNFVFKIGKSFFCYAGFAQRIKDYCQKAGIEYVEIGEMERLEPVRKPELPGIDWRDVQVEAIEIINKNQIGVVNLATGYGKTIFAAGLISTYDNPSVLFLCRSNDLVTQSYDVFKKLGFNPCKLGDGNKEITTNFVVSTTQTYKTLDLLELAGEFDIIFCDEAHKGFGTPPKKKGDPPNKERIGEYEQILKTCLAPVRVGLTATVPTKIQTALLLEGLIGPVVIKADTQTGIEEGILAKPKLEWLIIPENKSLSGYKTYNDLYKHGIVENNARNNVIASAVKKEIDNNNSCLLFCTEIEHIKNLSAVFTKNGIKHECVYGDISSSDRLGIKNRLEEKKNLVVVSSVVWAEGLDIRSLNCLFNVSGGKSSEVVVQKAGRALRVTEDKKTATIYDCLDQSRFLSEHTIKRLIAYKNLGWL